MQMTLNVKPIHEKRDYYCSENSAATVLGYYGKHVTPSSLNRAGCYHFDSILKCMGNEFGIAATNMATIRYSIEAGHPIIVSTIPDNNVEKGEKHSIVIIGFREVSRQKYVGTWIAIDNGNVIEIDRDDFDRQWSRAGHLAISKCLANVTPRNKAVQLPEGFEYAEKPSAGKSKPVTLVEIKKWVKDLNLGKAKDVTAKTKEKWLKKIVKAMETSGESKLTSRAIITIEEETGFKSGKKFLPVEREKRVRKIHVPEGKEVGGTDLPPSTLINMAEITKEGTALAAFIEKWDKKGILVYKGKNYGFITRIQGIKGIMYALARTRQEFNTGHYIEVRGNAKISLRV